MTYPACLSAYNFRHAVSVGCAVFLAALVNDYYSFSHECWTLLAAFLVSQTTRGTPLRQGQYYFMIIMIAILFSSLVFMWIQKPVATYAVTGIIFILGSFTAFLNRPLLNKMYFLILLFPLVMLIANMMPIHTEQLLYMRLADVVIGGVIGIVCGQIIFPVRFDREFQQGLVPLLRAMLDYSKVLAENLQHGKCESRLEAAKLRIENALQTTQGMYPEWVYEVGFNPGLRSGFRFFLVNLERVSDILFSLDYLVNSGLDVQSMQELSRSMEDVLHKNAELIMALIDYFDNKKITPSKSDFTSDIVALENTLHQKVPGSLELLDISPDYIKMTALVRDVKDLRELLLQLVLALPS